MGLFDFFKPKDKAGNKSNPAKPLIEPNAEGEFDLQLADFGTKTNTAEVTVVSISPDFYELFPEAEKPVNPGGKITINTYAAQIVFWKQPVEVTFNLDVASNNVEDFIKEINKQLNWLAKNQDVVEDVIIRDLLPLKNNNWLDENEAQLGSEKFLKLIYLTSIDFGEKAAIDLRYNDSDMFLGHGIVVEISPNREVRNASIEG